MDTGSISKIMGVIAEVVAAEDPSLIKDAKSQMIMIHGVNNPLMVISQLRREINNNLGYIAGFYEPRLGNKVLSVFQAQHPYFGDSIPADIGECYKLGSKLTKEFDKTQATREEAIKRAAKVKDLGVMLPESDETVSNDDAAKILAALHGRRAATSISARVPDDDDLYTIIPDEL